MPRTREELPVARRVRPQVRRRELPIGPVVLTAAIAIGGGLGALVLLRDELQKRFLGPLPVPGIAARLDLQGRLLGHFSYPEAPGARLVEIAPGFQLDRDAGEAFQQMQAAAAAEGIDLRLISAFRSIEMQKQIFFGVKSERNQTVEERAKGADQSQIDPTAPGMPSTWATGPCRPPTCPPALSPPLPSPGCSRMPPASTSSSPFPGTTARG